MKKVDELITEINLNYNDLGEDLVLFESVLQAMREKNVFPQEYIYSSLRRMGDEIEQHTGDIRQLSKFLIEEAGAAHRRAAPNEYR